MQSMSLTTRPAGTFKGMYTYGSVHFDATGERIGKYDAAGEFVWNQTFLTAYNIAGAQIDARVTELKASETARF